MKKNYPNFLSAKIITICIICVPFFITSFSQPSKAQQAPSAPKLVVGIVVDQMRYDYIYRYWDKFGNDGFKKLVNEGFFCKNTNYNYVPTYTGPGHASVYTGTTPSIHGIAGNNWYDRNTSRNVYCSEDKSVQTVGSPSWAGQMSPKNMLTTTVCDQLRLATNMKSKVIGIALKDRGAILPAGHTANGAFWFDDSNGAWITSSFYMKDLPQWVTNFNSKNQADVYLNQEWNTMLPIEKYTESIADENLYEGKLGGKSVFPYNLSEIKKQSGHGLVRNTPFGNSFTKDFAIEAIKGENLGKNSVTDFLCLSFSSTDYIGHIFGPQSIEMEDTYLRLDSEIADFLKFLDGWVGKNNALVFLTADHAAVEVPAYLAALKIPSGYIYFDGEINYLKSYFFKTYGDSLIRYYDNQQVYLDHKTMEEKKLKSEEIENHIASHFQKKTGVAQVVTATSLKNCDFNSVPRNLVSNGWNPKRSGDVMLNFEPGWVEFGKTGTTHGSPYSYDTHIPLIFYGWRIKPGTNVSEINITDIAPTISMLLNIQFPNGCTGKVIEDVLH